MSDVEKRGAHGDPEQADTVDASSRIVALIAPPRTRFRVPNCPRALR
jgi:hypothetical protein